MERFDKSRCTTHYQKDEIEDISIMTNKSIKRNYIYNTSYQILVLLTPLITTPYVSRILGADGIGTYSFTNSIVTYFTVFASLGTSAYGQREISYLQDDRLKRSKFFWEIEFLSCITVAISLAIYLFFIQGQNNKIIYLIQAINIITIAVDVTWLLQGMEEFGKIVSRNIVIKLLSIIFIFVFVKTKNDLPIYIFGMSVFILISNSFLWFYLPQFVDKPKWRFLNPLRHFKGTLSLFIPTVTTMIYTVLDKTMIGLFTKSYYENGYYEQAMKITKMALVLVTSLGTVMVPRIGFLFKQKDRKTLNDYMYKAYNFIWFSGIPLCFGLIGISHNLVPWFFGKEYDKVTILLCILSFLILAIGISSVTGVQYLIPTKRQNIFTFSVTVGAVLNLIINLILIPSFYSVGASIASIFAETAVVLVQFFILRKEISIPHVFGISKKYFAAGFIMLALLLFENTKFSPSIIHTCFMIISGMSAYFIMLFVFRDRFFISNLRVIFKKVYNIVR